MSTGLVHDYLLVMRGAERVFEAIAELWPAAPIYTALHSERGTMGRFSNREVRSSYLQRLPLRQRGFRWLLPLYPRAVESLPVREHDLLVSSSSAFAHGVRPRPDAIHICACHTPFRYAWHERDRALKEAPRPLRPLLGRMLERIRRWDLEASRRVTHFIALSELARERIQDCYGRDARLILPGADVERFSPGEPEDFFLVVGELVPHKRVASALEAARRAERRVVVVGEGPELERLRSGYGEVAEFLGRVSDPELAQLLGRARALVVPNVEEFGIAAIEAQAAGRPVVAIDAGGTRHTVIDGETGVLVADGSVDGLAEALREVDFDSFDPARIRRHAEQFSATRFKQRFRAEVERLAAHRGTPARR